MVNPDTLNSNNENEDAAGGAWAEFAAEMAEQESPDLPRSKKLQKELDNCHERLAEARKKYNGEVPSDIYNALEEQYNQTREAIREAQIEETLAIIPESQREAFRKYANSDWSIFSFDEIVDGIYRYSQGESLESIKEDILTKNWGGVDEEANRRRGEDVYKIMIGFLETDK